MIQKEVKIAGKKVTLAYCYATEIAFKDLSGEDISDFIKDAYISINDSKMPDAKKCIYAILAAILAYSNAKNEDAPVSDNDIMNNATPEEVGNAIGTIITLRAQFYHIPTGEEDKDKEEKPDEKEKNA